MILLLDVGNSMTKWRLLETGRRVAEGGLPTDGASFRVDFGVRPQMTVACCVAGAGVRAAWESRLDGPIHWLRPERSAHSVLNLYDKPEQLGPDRYAALVAARRLGVGDCVVACAGTALTADALTAEGEFLGGCIVPGERLMRHSLISGTAEVRAEAGWKPDWPRDTDSAVGAGLALALCGVVEGVRARLRADRQDRDIPIVLSGGAREGLRAHLHGPVREVDNIVLEGLGWIAKDLGCDV